MKKFSILFLAIGLAMIGCTKENNPKEITDDQIEALYQEIKPLADAILLSENPNWTALAEQYKDRDEIKEIDIQPDVFFIEFSNGYTRTWLTIPTEEEMTNIETKENLNNELIAQLISESFIQMKTLNLSLNETPKIAIIVCDIPSGNINPTESVNELYTIFHAKGWDYEIFPPNKADVELFRTALGIYDVIYIFAHGNSNGGHSYLTTGEKVTNSTKTKHILIKQNDIRTTSEFVQFTGDFISDYCSFPLSPFIYLGSCKLMMNPDQFAKHFIDKGAKVVVGWDHFVRNGASASGKEILCRMLLNDQNLKQTFDNLPLAYKEDFIETWGGIKIPAIFTRSDLQYYGRDENNNQGLWKGGDYKLPYSDGLTEDVHNIIPDDVLEKLNELGIEINGGNNPPNIEGTYFISPLVITKTNFGENLNAQGRMNMNLSFSKQNSTDLTVVVDYTKNYLDQGVSLSGTGLGSFITGEGNKFSVFYEADGTSRGGYYKTVEVISGEISETGIRNWQRAYIMVVANSSTIAEGNGRLNEDSDGFSERL